MKLRKNNNLLFELLLETPRKFRGRGGQPESPLEPGVQGTALAYYSLLYTTFPCQFQIIHPK